MSAPPRTEPTPPPRREVSRELAELLPDLVTQGDDAAVGAVAELLATLLKPGPGPHAKPANVIDLAARRRERGEGG